MARSLFKKTWFKKPWIWIQFSVLFFAGCTFRSKKKVPLRQKQNVPAEILEQKVKQERPVITVWVHGTRAISKTIFPHFFRAVPGIHHASAYNNKNNLLRIAHALDSADPKDFAFKNMYMFGWDGRLSVKRRKNAARKLYKEILELREQAKKKYGVMPFLRIVTHSHGGNVTLYMAEIQDEFNEKFNVDELVLLACPVQKRTSDFIQDNMFTNIYSFYSKIDMIQVLDPQGLQKVWSRKEKRKPGTPLFSQRTFPEQDNLKQIKVRMNGRSLRHIDFILEKFLKELPRMLNEIRS